MTGESQGWAGDQTLRPDPTILTTEQLLRELLGLRTLLEAKLDGMETNVGLQFRLVEQQRIEQKSDTKAAVDAALTAQKEAVREQTSASERAIAKSEAAMLEQLKQLSATFTTAISGVGISLSDLKDRVGRIESVKVGGRDAYAGLYALAGFVALAVTIGSVIFAIAQAGGS